MTALAANKKVNEIDAPWARLSGDMGAPLAAGVFFVGALVGYDTSDGKLKPWATVATLQPAGVCFEAAGANSASVKIKSGIYKFVNGGDITSAHVGTPAYGTDDQTVTITTTTRSKIGIIVRLESDGVYVAVNPDVEI